MSTVRRHQRIEEVLRSRQPDLTVVLENVHDLHNVLVALRTCDAVGVLETHLLYTVEPVPELSHRTSASAYKWVVLRRHSDTAHRYAVFKQQDFHVWATAVSPEAASIFTLDLTRPTALAFGNEHCGVSSVARAVALSEAFRQRWVAGLYEQPRLPAETLQKLL